MNNNSTKKLKNLKNIKEKMESHIFDLLSKEVALEEEAKKYQKNANLYNTSKNYKGRNIALARKKLRTNRIKTLKNYQNAALNEERKLDKLIKQYEKKTKKTDNDWWKFNVPGEKAAETNLLNLEDLEPVKKTNNVSEKNWSKWNVGKAPAATQATVLGRYPRATAKPKNTTRKWFSYFSKKK